MIYSNLSFSKNLLLNVFEEKLFHKFTNSFKLKKIKIGPFLNKNFLNLKIENFKNIIKFDSSNKFETLNYKYSVKESYLKEGNLVNYSIFEFNDNFIIEEDLNFNFENKKLKFNNWLNLQYITIENFILTINEIVSKEFYNPLNLPSPIKGMSRKGFNMSDFMELGDLSQLKTKTYKNDQSSLLSIKEENEYTEKHFGDSKIIKK